MNAIIRKRQTFLLDFNKKTALRASIIISFINMFIALVTVTFMFPVVKEINLGVHNVRVSEIIITFVINTLFLYVLFITEFWMIRRSKIKCKKTKSNLELRLSFFVLLIGVVFASMLISNLLGRWVWFRGDLTPSMFAVFSLMRDLIAFVLSMLFTALIYLNNKNQKSLIENERLITENVINRYNALKNQTDPHFLFNSLNTLNGLIGYDDERAHGYVEQLAAVFRYTMKDDSVVTLAEELQFAESYIYLMKIRYDDGLDIKINVEEKYNNYLILPFGLQTLVENALKHNVVSRKFPLEIIIETTSDAKLKVVNKLHRKFKVVNNLNPKPNLNENRGLGLANLNERYRLMFNKEIEITADSAIFSVEIPLIKA
ncbi:sensor histidine kinase [Petrimonas sp.]|uniref:sensor histidine kinase n=1 Tax=Petrimonas sp. TaxID=2023866 RepID=UPI003F516ED6